MLHAFRSINQSIELLEELVEEQRKILESDGELAALNRLNTSEEMRSAMFILACRHYQKGYIIYKMVMEMYPTVNLLRESNELYEFGQSGID